MSRASRLRAAEIEAARTRFAKANVFNLTEPLIQNNDVAHAYDAARRIRHVMQLGVEEADNDRAAQVLGKLIDLIQGAEMTINFDAVKWFKPDGRLDPLKLTTYLNVWQAREMISTNLGDGRVQAENRMFRYKEGVVGDGLAEAGNTRAVAASVAAQGTANVDALMKPTNDAFRSGMRPGYAALNVGAHVAGAARFYASNCLVLSHCLRFNATFSHHDSVNKDVSQESLCSYFHLFKIVEKCDQGLLEKMIAKVEETNLDPFTASGTKYIEAQLHCDVRFDRDVEKMRVCRPDFEGTGALHDARLTAKAKAKLMKFAATNGIQLVWHNGG